MNSGPSANNYPLFRIHATDPAITPAKTTREPIASSPGIETAAGANALDISVEVDKKFR
jgi:hypothetical protein